MKDKLIVVSGPTASGKTATAISLAKKYNGEIVSADSMQVYKYMDIGTAKPSKEELEEAKHWMIDEIEPDEEFNIAVFKKMASRYIEDIISRGKVPILAGGTGFYTNAIIYNTEFAKTEQDDRRREELYHLAEVNGNEYVHEMLREIDIKSYEQLHCNNVKKVVRAIEFFEQTGKPISEHNEEEQQKEPYYDVYHIVLDVDRKVLYDRIDSRVDKMVQDGLVEEVEKLNNMGYGKDLVSMQGIGYKELYKWIDGEMELDESIELIKKNSRNYAKKQLTWFRNKSNATWIDTNGCSTGDEIVCRIEEVYKNKL